MEYRKIETNDDVDFDKLTVGDERLVPAIIIDRAQLALGQIGCIRMVGFMNREALEATQANGNVTFFSRSTQKLWTKGETSGNTLQVDEIYIDCDNDTLLITADATGPTCHTGSNSCFETQE